MVCEDKLYPEMSCVEDGLVKLKGTDMVGKISFVTKHYHCPIQYHHGQLGQLVSSKKFTDQAGDTLH